MIFDKTIRKYLDGEAVSNGLAIKISGDNPAGDRLDRILEIVQGTSVLHVGCADHMPLIKKKMSSKTWLHGRLESVCSRLIGLDIAEDAIKYIKSLGVPNVYTQDITSDRISLKSETKSGSSWSLVRSSNISTTQSRS